MTDALSGRCERAVHVLGGDGTLLAGGRASMFVLERIGWHPRLARLGRTAPFVWLVELGYRTVARNRPFFARFMFRKE
jgi:hypothetical protein